jgi:tRNA(fMet)-specific endonuclease VapC
MKQYLLDTNIVIFLFRNKYDVSQKIITVGHTNCFISEITLAELKMGAEKSSNPSANHQLINRLVDLIQVIPISKVLDTFAKEKIRLEKQGTPMHDNFDLLIGVTAIENQLTLITENTNDFKCLEGIEMENWIVR